MNTETQQLLNLIGERAENYFSTGQLYCSEAILLVLNEGLGGGLTPELAIKLASAQPEGIGGSGCLCGALGGGTLALGLFLGRERPGERDSNRARTQAKRLHNLFRMQFGSTCCRALCKKAVESGTSKYGKCASISAETAKLVAQLILEQRPELAKGANLNFLERRDSKLGAQFKRLANLVSR